MVRFQTLDRYLLDCWTFLKFQAEKAASFCRFPIPLLRAYYTQSSPLTVNTGYNPHNSYNDTFVCPKKNRLILQGVGESDTPITVTILAVPKSVTVSGEPCSGEFPNCMRDVNAMPT